jgi:predicted nucleotidyltransferase
MNTFSYVKKMIADEKYKDFIIAWQKRIKKQESKEEKIIKKAKEFAVKCAHLLIEKFGAKKVFLFGSLKDGYFHENSDIDLAVEGLPVSLYFKALAEVHRMNNDFRIELIPLEDCLFKESILKEGELIYEHS